VRVGDDPATISASPPVTFAAPPTISPAALESRLIAAGLPTTSRYLSVTASLDSTTTGDAAPVLSWFEAQWDCVPGL
jgi:hypothetical protein